MTRAAEALNITQSAASAAIAALETRHGVRLFDRVGRGLALSEAGRAFLPEARAVLVRADAAAQALDDLAGLRRGALAIAASQTVANYWLPARLAKFARAQPSIALSLTVGNTSQVARAVLEGEVDLGFVEGEVVRPPLARAAVGRDRLALYAAPGHPLADRPVKPEDLLALDWVLREAGSGTRAAFAQALEEQGLNPSHLRISLELPSNEAALEAAAAGWLVTAVSELAARPWLTAGRLRRLDIDLPSRAFELLTHGERRRSHAAAAFLDMISEHDGLALRSVSQMPEARYVRAMQRDDVITTLKSHRGQLEELGAKRLYLLGALGGVTSDPEAALDLAVDLDEGPGGRKPLFSASDVADIQFALAKILGRNVKLVVRADALKPGGASQFGAEGPMIDVF